jgi:hypothetical protein
MKEMNRYLLQVVTQSLQGGSPAQHRMFDYAIECTWASLEFYMYAQFKFHENSTLTYTEDALHRFHTFKDISLHGRTGKKAKANANALRSERMKNPKVNEETNAEPWTLSKKRHQRNT